MSQAGDKLAATRQAIVEQAQRKERRREHSERPFAADEGETAGGPPADEGSWLGGLGHALKTWWRHHPAHMALELATPVLSGYAPVSYTHLTLPTIYSV